MASLVCLMAAAVGKSDQTLSIQESIIRALWPRMMLSNAAFLPECFRASHASKGTKKRKKKKEDQRLWPQQDALKLSVAQTVYVRGNILLVGLLQTLLSLQNKKRGGRCGLLSLTEENICERKKKRYNFLVFKVLICQFMSSVSSKHHIVQIQINSCMS